MKNKIIYFLNNYWNSKGFIFGKIIWDLKPLNYSDWLKYLKDKKFFLIKNSILIKNGFDRSDIESWIKYITISFWHLYESELAATIYFKDKHKIKLKFASRSLDFKYGIDFTFYKNNFLIVKAKLNNDINDILFYKQLRFFKYRSFNLSNSRIWVFNASDNKLYLFDYKNNKLLHLINPKSWFLTSKTLTN